MKRQWSAYLIVGVLSVGAGVAIAGLPDIASGDATIAVPPSSSEMAGSTVPETTAAPTTVSATTEPDVTTEPATTVPTNTVPDTTGTGTADSLPVELPDRSELRVAAANGANVAGAALRVATTLESVGYVDVLPLNGTDIFEFTTIYFADGFEEAALRLADDLELLPLFVAPIAAMPPVIDLPADAELVAYIGSDRA
jgi:hypothetical protein